MGFLPVPALAYLDPVADVLAAPDLGRTHPLPVQAAWQQFAVKDGASQLDVGAPDAGAQAIIGASTARILRRTFPQGSSYGCLQVPGKVNVLMHIALALFRDREGTHPHQIARALPERNRCGAVAGEGVQIDRRGIEWRVGSIACEVFEQRMRQQARGVGHRPGQHLIQVADGGEQTPRVCKFPAPPGVLGEGEYQATRFPLPSIPWQEESTGRSGWLL